MPPNGCAISAWRRSPSRQKRPGPRTARSSIPTRRSPKRRWRPVAPARRLPIRRPLRKPSPKPAPRAGRRKLALIGAAAAVLLAAGGWYGYHYLTVGRYLVSTDDAYVRADATTLAAKVAGYVSSIDVADNSLVHAGDVIARIDDGDYRLAAQAARDKVATQQATVGRIGQQIVAAQAAVAQARAQLASTRAVETRTASELKRQQALASKEFASRQTLEQAQSSRDQAIASVQSAQAAVASADRQCRRARSPAAGGRASA